MLTLEEAIKQYEQFLNVYKNRNLTESQEVQKVIEQLATELREWREPSIVDNCEGCVKEFDKRYLLVIKQLVAWLRELQERREKDNCYGCKHKPFEEKSYCRSCKRICLDKYEPKRRADADD